MQEPIILYHITRCAEYGESVMVLTAAEKFS